MAASRVRLRAPSRALSRAISISNAVCSPSPCARIAAISARAWSLASYATLLSCSGDAYLGSVRFRKKASALAPASESEGEPRHKEGGPIRSQEGGEETSILEASSAFLSWSSISSFL